MCVCMYVDVDENGETMSAQAGKRNADSVTLYADPSPLCVGVLYEIHTSM